MGHWKDMPAGGAIVIIVIAALFVAALIMLFHLYGRYRRLSRLIREGDEDRNDFLRYTLDEFTAAYKLYGKDTNTPGIIADAMGSRLSGLLLRERYLNNAVSLFVTLGLFGTFLGLSMAVTSLTQLIGFSNTSEWLSVLDSVGGGLMSALSGMGVAFYTSLVGAGCSIVLTILRTVFNPQSQREKLATQMELWLDHDVAPTLPTRTAKDEAELVQRMIDALNRSAASMEKTLDAAGDRMEKTMDAAGEGLKETMEGSKPYLVAFHQTVEKFNNGVHDFSEVDYNLRGSVERLDLAVRDLVGVMRQASRTPAKGEDR